MKMKFVRLITVTSLILLAAAACQVTPSTKSAAPITNQNVAQLSAAVQVVESGLISDLVWSADSSMLIALSGDGAMRFDGQTLEELDMFSFENPTALYAVSSDGKTVAFSEDSYNIFLADMSVTQDAKSIYSPDWVGYIDFSPDGQTFLATSIDEIKVTLWDVASGEETGMLDGFETAAPVYSAKFGEDGAHVIWISRGTVQLSDIADGSLGPVMGHEDFVNSAVLSPDGSVLATAAYGTVDGEFGPAVYLWDTASGEVSATLTYPESLTALAFSPDGSLLAAISDRTIILWNVASVEMIAEITSDDDSIVDIAFAPDGSALATAALDGTLTLWQVGE